MRDKRRSRTWLSWLTVVALGFALVSGFVLVGGFGTGQGDVALARTRGADSTSSSTTATSSVAGPTTASGDVFGISTDACAGRTLAGIVGLNGKPAGQITLGLFALSQHQLPLARRFFDTGQRVTVTYGGLSSVPFLFQTVPGGAVDYLVVVLPKSGPITTDGSLVESAVLPVCGTRKVTVTATVTTTVTSTSTSTTTVNSTQTVTVNNQQVVVVTSSSSSCGVCCLWTAAVGTSAKSAAASRHYTFAQHARYMAKKTFTANLTFTGLVKIHTSLSGCCITE